ncbi:MAG: class I SAM-dependent methyltransferase [Alphaproteobacteria bacterium]
MWNVIAYTMPNYCSKLRKFVHLARDSRHNVNLAVNEELFWNQYVHEWEKSDKNNNLGYLGAEWKYEEDFVSLLQKCASSQKEALEIGCGGGRITATGVKLFKHVYAADISAEMLRKSKEAITASNVSFHKLDGFTLKEFADATIGFVYSHDVFVQLSSIQVYPYLREIKRVLKPRGIGLVSCYDFVDQFELFKQWSLKFWNERRVPVYRRLHFLTEEMLRAMLSDLGMETVGIQKRRFLIVTFRK